MPNSPGIYGSGQRREARPLPLVIRSCATRGATVVHYGNRDRRASVSFFLRDCVLFRRLLFDDHSSGTFLELEELKKLFAVNRLNILGWSKGAAWVKDRGAVRLLSPPLSLSPGRHSWIILSTPPQFFVLFVSPTRFYENGVVHRCSLRETDLFIKPIATFWWAEYASFK